MTHGNVNTVNRRDRVNIKKKTSNNFFSSLLSTFITDLRPKTNVWYGHSNPTAQYIKQKQRKISDSKDFIFSLFHI